MVELVTTDTMTLQLYCKRCHSTHLAEANVGLDTDGDFVIPAGTLANDWVLRWSRSHQEPCAHVVVVT